MADSNLTPDFVARGHISRGCWAPELSGKVAIVTGAGRLRGIGRMTALELARQGVHVIVTGTGRDPSRYTPDEKEVGWRDVHSVADEVKGYGVEGIAVEMSIAADAAVAQLFADVTGRFGHVDILINNASAARGPDCKSVLDMDAVVWRHVLEVNVTGTMLMARATAADMVRRGEGGSIVNISSIASKVPLKNISAYAASKAAVDMFSRCLAQEVAANGIRVNSINPGGVETARLDDVGRGEAWQAARAAVPLGWASDGMDIAHMAVFLASDMGAWITGQAINVDGGRAW